MLVPCVVNELLKLLLDVSELQVVGVKTRPNAISYIVETIRNSLQTVQLLNLQYDIMAPSKYRTERLQLFNIPLSEAILTFLVDNRDNGPRHE